MKVLSIDIETFSSVNLQKCGVYKYAESEDFEILLFGYAVDGGAVQVVDLACGESIPAEIIDALTDDSVIKTAYNATFETVCLLSKLHEAKHHVNVRLDMDELDVTSAESKATYEEIKSYVAEHNDGMKVSNLYIAQVKAKYGIIERENYNKPKSDDARQPKCPKEKENAIVEALRYFRMI